MSIAPNKVFFFFFFFFFFYVFFFNWKVLLFFLFLHENICYWCSLEAPQWGASNEYPQHMFLWRNKKNLIRSYGGLFSLLQMFCLFFYLILSSDDTFEKGIFELGPIYPGDKNIWQAPLILRKTINREAIANEAKVLRLSVMVSIKSSWAKENCAFETNADSKSPTEPVCPWLLVRAFFSACRKLTQVTFRGDWSWNNFRSQSPPSTDARRTVISDWQKYVQKYWAQLFKTNDVVS